MSGGSLPPTVAAAGSSRLLHTNAVTSNRPYLRSNSFCISRSARKSSSSARLIRPHCLIANLFLLPEHVWRNPRSNTRRTMRMYCIVYSGDARAKFSPGHHLPCELSWISSVPTGKSRYTTSTRSHQLPSTSSVFHHSPPVLPFHATQSHTPTNVK